MTSAVDQLIAMVDDPDPWQVGGEALSALQLWAVNERFAERRGAVAVLDRRARDQEIERIDSFADLAPLLFSHTTYKSYPESFLTKGRWDMMTKWLATLSAVPVEGIGLDGIQTVDDWIERLHQAGHYVFASSGTTGHCSFLNQTGGDRAFRERGFRASNRVMTGMSPSNDRVVFLAGPKLGFTSVQEYQNMVARTFARPGGAYFLFEGGASVHDLNRTAALRRALAAGTATPAELAAAQAQSAGSEGRMSEAIERYAAHLIAHRDEPCFLMGTYSMQYAVVEAIRARGFNSAGIHPDTIIQIGGGLKGAKGLPEDFVDQVRAFYALPARQFLQGYGMGEVSSPFPACEHGRYHVPPWIILLILDKSGEHLIESDDGIFEGRAAAFDVSVQSRWAGVISGDRLTVDRNPCPCGRASSTITGIVRYSDLPEGDDKLTCAGTIDSYVRGIVGETA